jgi:hypothetical protein
VVDIWSCRTAYVDGPLPARAFLSKCARASAVVCPVC